MRLTLAGVIRPCHRRCAAHARSVALHVRSHASAELKTRKKRVTPGSDERHTPAKRYVADHLWARRRQTRYLPWDCARAHPFRPADFARPSFRNGCAAPVNGENRFRAQIALRHPLTPTAIILNCLTAVRLISSIAAASVASSIASAITIIEFTNRLARMLRSSPLQVFNPGNRARSIANSDVINRISVRIA